MEKLAGIFYVVSFFLIFMIFPSSISAVTVGVKNIPSAISADPFSVEVEVNGASPGTNYLRIDLFKEGTKNYFGQTYNGSNWYGGSDGKQYLPISISQTKIATTSVQGKVGEPNGKEYIGPGSYKLRIRRYTESGSSYTTSDPVDVQINIALPTPTPTPKATPKTITSSAAKSSLNSESAEDEASILTTKENVDNAEEAVEGEVLSQSQSEDNILDGIFTENDLAKNSNLNMPVTVSASPSAINNQLPVGLIFIGSGILFSAAAGTLVYMRQKASNLI